MIALLMVSADAFTLPFIFGRTITRIAGKTVALHGHGYSSFKRIGKESFDQDSFGKLKTTKVKQSSAEQWNRRATGTPQTTPYPGLEVQHRP